MSTQRLDGYYQTICQSSTCATTVHNQSLLCKNGLHNTVTCYNELAYFLASSLPVPFDSVVPFASAVPSTECTLLRNLFCSLVIACRGEEEVGKRGEKVRESGREEKERERENVSR